jgi:hypothetical protein
MEPTRKRSEPLSPTELQQLLQVTGIELSVQTKQGAALLGVAEQTMRRWASEGSGPIRPTRVGNRLRWAVSDIKRLLAGETAA